MKPESYRLFIALTIPKAIKDRLAEAEDELRAKLRGGGIKWTRPEQMHLTLRFLGNVPSERVVDVTRGVSEACAGFAPFPARAERLGFFPQAGMPRVIWAWVHDDRGVLPRLHQAIATATRAFGEDEEKGFTGHVTLGRAGKLSSTQVRVLREAALAMATRVFGDWTVAAVEVIRSELSPAGSRHTVLAEVPLLTR